MRNDPATGAERNGMDVSVIICTYNRSDSLRRTLECLEKMVVPREIRWELLLVDNNSKDDTKKVVESFLERTNIRLTYLLERNQGLSFARNNGIRHAAGDIVVFTDDDVLVDENWLRNIYGFFRKHDDVACVGGKILPFWEAPPPKWVKGDLLNILALCDLGDEERYLSEIKIWGANLSFRASVIRKYGGFDTEFGHKGGKLYGGEETRYMEALLEGGEKIMYSSSIVVRHCISESRLKEKYFRKWYFDKGEFHAIRMGDYRKRNIFGIPLIIFRLVIHDSFRYVKLKLFHPEKSVQCKLSLMYNIGIMFGRIKYRLNGSAV